MTVAAGNGHEAGRALLAQMYYDRTGLPLPLICQTPMGKPYFPDDSLHFSISHTKKHVFCALSSYPIGIDAEEMDRKVSLALAPRILSQNELRQFHTAPDPSLALLKFWVLKEAEAKLTGKGIAYPPNHTDYSLDDPRICIIDGCIIAVMEDKNHAL